MSKTFCLNRFYSLLDDLEEKIGGRRQLGRCSGKMYWPKRGVYFFFEPGEMRTVKPYSSRVVRVGANAITTTNTSSTLWEKIKKHKGTKTRRGGDHRTSVFRCLIGNAIGQQNPELMPESWESWKSWKQEGTIPPEIRELEYPHEIRVSNYLAAMELLFVCVPDASGSNNMRETIKRQSIALLSSYRESSPDRPSSGWLGRDSTREEVQRSGLWNDKHVEEGYKPTFLDDFERIIRAM